MIASLAIGLILLAQDVDTLLPATTGVTQTVSSVVKLLLVVVALAEIVAAIGLGMKASWSYPAIIILVVIFLGLGFLFDIHTVTAFNSAVSGSPSGSAGFYVLDYSFLFGYGIFYFVIAIVPLYVLLTHQGLKYLLRRAAVPQ